MSPPPSWARASVGMEAGACPRPRGGRAASRDTAAAANKNLNLVDVYDIAADIGKVGPDSEEFVFSSQS